MAIVVEHEKRKHEILQKALDVFVEEGYEDVTFQKIADRCGITRTTLYIYFKNKREIFLWSIKEMLSGLELSLNAIVSDQNLSSESALRQILSKLIDECQENRKTFSVLLTYLMQLKKSGIDPVERVRRRVIRLRHLMTTVIIRGIQSGEFKELNIRDMNELLYGLIESVIFRIAVLDEKDVSFVRTSFGLAVDSFVIRPTVKN